MKYRKKPVVIEAVRWAYDENESCGRAECRAFDAIKALSGDGRDVAYNADGTLSIRTLEGVMRANVGDYVIRGIKGEIYPCKPDIFHATYEKV